MPVLIRSAGRVSGRSCSPCRCSWSPAPVRSLRPAARRSGAGRGGRRAGRVGRAGRRRPGSPPGGAVRLQPGGPAGPHRRVHQRQRRQLARRCAGGALGGTVDVSMASTADGLFQCALPSAGRPESASCVRLGERDDAIPRRSDPRVQHPLTDWLDVLTDRRAPLAVAPATAPEGLTGTCYSVDSTSASLNAPLDVGIYCYDRDGTPTGVRTGAGTLRLAAPPGPPPGTVQLAGPVVVDREPLDTAAPPTPDPSGSPDAGTP
ncbi:hypothetical protein NKG94_37695 [Micromonospora sp. M12]